MVMMVCHLYFLKQLNKNDVSASLAIIISQSKDTDIFPNELTLAKVVHIFLNKKTTILNLVTTDKCPYCQQFTKCLKGIFLNNFKNILIH